MADKTLNECPDLGPNEPLNIDDPPPYCCPKECDPPSQRETTLFDDIKKVFPNDKTGHGFSALCDPMQTGSIVNDPTRHPNRNTIYRYSRGVRGCDEAMMDLFRDMIVIDEQAVAHPVPIIWATQERAVAAVIQPNVRKDNSLVVDRIRLPMLAIYNSNFDMDMDRYTYHNALNFQRNDRGKPTLFIRENKEFSTVLGLARGIPVNIGYQLTAWTLYVEDMNQILEQILLKFSPIAYIRIQGVQYEVGVKLDAIANNIDMEPGDTANRVIKFQFNMTAETYIPQPIARRKPVLDARVAIMNNIRDDEVTEIIDRLEVGIND